MSYASEFKAPDFVHGERVIYVPRIADSNASHPGCEHGAVSSVNLHYVFVKFDQYVNQFGWEGAASQSCDTRDLMKIAAVRKEPNATLDT